MCHTECLRFCFLGIFQGKLTKFMTFWNHPLKWKVKNSESPSGIPDYLNYVSGSNSNVYTDYKITVDITDKKLANSFTKSPIIFDFSEDFSEFAIIIIQKQNLSMPRTVSEAAILHVTIVNEISSIWCDKSKPLVNNVAQDRTQDVLNIKLHFTIFVYWFGGFTIWGIFKTLYFLLLEKTHCGLSFGTQ